MATSIYPIWLAVPPDEREEAKKAAGKLDDGRQAIEWDGTAKLWFARPGAQLERLSAWMPDPSRRIGGGDAEAQFLDALTQAGLIIKGMPVMNGKRQRVATVEDKGKGKKSGVYTGYLDRRPAGWIVNYHRTDEVLNWKAVDGEADPITSLHLRAGARQAQDDAERDRAETHRKNTDAARRLYDRLPAADPAHPYLERKGIPPTPDIRQTKNGALVVPFFSAQGEFKTLQYITADGDKLLFKDAPKQGAFLAVGGPLQAGQPILYAEGYATARSLNLALNIPVVMTIDAGNMVTVAQALKQEYPERKHLFLADFDHAKDENKGLLKATEAAALVGGRALYPQFTDAEKGRGFTDYNDLHHSRGLAALRDQVLPAVLALQEARTMVEENKAQAAPVLDSPALSTNEEKQTAAADLRTVEPIATDAPGQEAAVVEAPQVATSAASTAPLILEAEVPANQVGTEAGILPVTPQQEAQAVPVSDSPVADRPAPAFNSAGVMAGWGLLGTSSGTAADQVQLQSAARPSEQTTPEPSVAAAPVKEIPAPAAPVQSVPSLTKEQEQQLAAEWVKLQDFDLKTRQFEGSDLAKKIVEELNHRQDDLKAEKQKARAQRPFVSSVLAMTGIAAYQDRKAYAAIQNGIAALAAGQGDKGPSLFEAAHQDLNTKGYEAINAGRAIDELSPWGSQKAYIQTQKELRLTASGELLDIGNLGDMPVVGTRRLAKTIADRIVQEQLTPDATNALVMAEVTKIGRDAVRAMAEPVLQSRVAASAEPVRASEPARSAPQVAVAPAEVKPVEAARPAAEHSVIQPVPEAMERGTLDLPAFEAPTVAKLDEAGKLAQEVQQAATEPAWPARAAAPVDQVLPTDLDPAGPQVVVPPVTPAVEQSSAEPTGPAAGELPVMQSSKTPTGEKVAEEVDGIEMGPRRPQGDVEPIPGGGLIDKDMLLARLTYERHGDQALLFKLDGEPAFVDRGTRLEMVPGASQNDEKVLAALLTAAHFHHGRIELTGSEAFKAKAIELIVQHDLNVTMKNPLQRQQLEEARQAQGAAPSSKDEITGDVPPAFRGATPTGQVSPVPSQQLQPEPLSAQSTIVQPDPPVAQASPAPTVAAAPRVGAEIHQSPTAAKEGVIGKVLDSGNAPYQFEKDNEMSTFIKLRTQQGVQTYWGKELAGLLRDTRVKPNSVVELRWLGKQPVTVKVPIKDAEGVTRGFEDKQAHRNQWSLTPVGGPSVQAGTDEGIKMAAYDAQRFAHVQQALLAQLPVQVPMPAMPQEGLFWLMPDGQGSAKSGDELSAPRPQPDAAAAGQPVMSSWAADGSLDLVLVRGDGPYLQGVVRWQEEYHPVMVSLPGQQDAPPMVFNLVTADGLVPIGTGNGINRSNGEPVAREHVAFKLEGDSAVRIAKLESPAELPATLHARLGFDERWRSDTSLPKSSPAAAAPQAQPNTHRPG
jgi:putative DNA primase/helicase